MWRGQKHIIPEDKDELLKTFQKKTLPTHKDTSFPLYHSNSNIRYTGAKIEQKDITWLSNEDDVVSKVNLPFSIRHPLHKGYHFFTFTSKYYAIHQFLFSDNHTDSSNIEIKQTREYYKIVYNNDMSTFLCAYMQLCLLMYYDVFKSKGLYQAIQYFDYFIGSIRIEKYYVRKEAIKNSLLEAENDLLDVISQAYLPQEIFDFIASEPSIRMKYKKLNTEDINAIRRKYIDRVKSCYTDVNDIKNRLQWIK